MTPAQVTHHMSKSKKEMKLANQPVIKVEMKVKKSKKERKEFDKAGDKKNFKDAEKMEKNPEKESKKERNERKEAKELKKKQEKREKKEKKEKKKKEKKEKLDNQSTEDNFNDKTSEKVIKESVPIKPVTSVFAALLEISEPEKPVKPTVNNSVNTVKTAVNNSANTVKTVPIPVVSVRKPVSIRTPGSNRVTRDINPVYTSSPSRPIESPQENSFTLRGINDTEQSRLLARTFADKWYLPAVLQRIEQQTGLSYRRGKFSEEEKDLARRLTLKFCHDQNMSLDSFKRVFFDEMGSREGIATSNSGRLSNFFVDAAQHFGGRPVVAIYELLKRMYHPGNHRGPWTQEEDEILLQEYRKHGPKWTLIGKELNRLGTNCRDRYNLRWKNADQNITGPWSSVEEQKLAEAISDSLRNTGVISWIWVSEERVRTRTPLQCLTHYKSKSFHDPNSIKIAKNPLLKTPTWNGWKEDEDFLLIHALALTGFTSETLVNWRSLKVEGIPDIRHNHELFFRRWNFLKSKAALSQGQEPLTLKEQVEKVKRYLIGKSKSAAYIFSEDDE